MKGEAVNIAVRRLESGFWHVRGYGPCNWAQPPQWPCSEAMLREYAFSQAGEEFILAAMQLAETGRSE